MVNWIEGLYAASLELDLPADVVSNMEVLPDVLTKHLALLKRFGYTVPLVTVIDFGFKPALKINYSNHLLGRCFVLIFNITELHPKIWMRITRDTPEYQIAFPDGYFIQKSNGKISDENFKLSSYPGDLEEKVKGFSEFLTGQFTIRGLFWLDGTGWMDGYGIDI